MRTVSNFELHQCTHVHSGGILNFSAQQTMAVCKRMLFPTDPVTSVLQFSPHDERAEKRRPYAVMVREAVAALDQGHGCSRQKVVRYVREHNVVGRGVEKMVSGALRSGVERGELAQVRGVGANGSFSVVGSGKAQPRDKENRLAEGVTRRKRTAGRAHRKGKKSTKLQLQDPAELPSEEVEGAEVSGDAVAEEDGLCEYERRRLRNIRENMAMLATLNLLPPPHRCQQPPKKLPSKEKQPVLPPPEPTRRSLRLQKVCPDGLPLPPPSTSPPAVSPPAWDPRLPALLQMSSVAHGEGESSLRDHVSSLSPSSLCPPAQADKNRLSFYSRLALTSVSRLTPRRIYVLALMPSPLSLVAAAGDLHGHLGLWRPGKSAGGVCTYRPHSRTISGICFPPSSSSSSSSLFSCSYDGTLRRADFQQGVFSELYSTPEHLDLCLTSCDHSRQSDWLLVSQGDGTVCCVDPRASGQSGAWQCHSKWIKSVHLNPLNDVIFATASKDCSVAVWDLRMMKGQRSFLESMPDSRSVTSAFFSPLTGTRLLTTSLDNAVRLYYFSGVGGRLVMFRNFAHNTQTGRWLSCFRACWDPRSEDCFIIGSMAQPRQVVVYSVAGCSPAVRLRGELLTSVASLSVTHSSLPNMVSANASGKVFLWSAPSL